MSTAPTRKIKKGQRAGTGVGVQRKALWTFVDQRLWISEKRMEIGIHRAARLSSWGSVTMNPVGALKMNIIICFRHFEVHLPQVEEGNGLLLACATSASRIRLWPVCSHYESFSALEIVDSRLSLVGESQLVASSRSTCGAEWAGVPPGTG